MSKAFDIFMSVLGILFIIGITTMTTVIIYSRTHDRKALETFCTTEGFETGRLSGTEAFCYVNKTPYLVHKECSRLLCNNFTVEHLPYTPERTYGQPN